VEGVRERDQPKGRRKRQIANLLRTHGVKEEGKGERNEMGLVTLENSSHTLISQTILRLLVRVFYYRPDVALYLFGFAPSSD